jgi:hypothetical protein
MRAGKTMVALMTLLIPALAWSQGGPRIVFDKQNHDYGKVRYGDKVVEEFSFTNTGDETLIIEQLRASCGCTKALKGSTEIPPGGKSKITAEFDTTDLRSGLKQKTIYVHSNDPENSIVKLNLTADVIRELSLNPPSLAKKLHDFADTVTFPVKISNTSDHVYAVTGLDAHGSDLHVTLKPDRVSVGPQGAAGFDLEIKLEKEAHRQFYMGKVLLLTDHPTEKRIEVQYLIRLEQIGKN